MLQIYGQPCVTAVLPLTHFTLKLTCRYMFPDNMHYHGIKCRSEKETERERESNALKKKGGGQTVTNIQRHTFFFLILQLQKQNSVIYVYSSRYDTKLMVCTNVCVHIHLFSYTTVFSHKITLISIKFTATELLKTLFS